MFYNDYSSTARAQTAREERIDVHDLLIDLLL